MNKNVRYWILGIAAAIIILAIIGFTAYNGRGAGKSDNPSSISGTGLENGTAMESGTSANGESVDHNNMDHGAMGQNNAGTSTGDEKLTAYLNDQDSIMAEMMERMAEIPHSGNASIDFLYGMIPHHESAIDMAESYLTYGSENGELKTIAENIIKTQQEEIRMMQDLIKNYEEDGQKDTDKEAAYLEEYNLMFSDHSNHGSMNSSAAANVEQAFAQGMIMHHQMAVDMAKSILEYTDYEEIRTLSQDIIKVQEKEIEEMSRLSGTENQ